MRHVPWLFFSLFTLSLCLASRVAHAQEMLDDERARAHFGAGESHFAAQRWDDAEREFSLAYELSHRPEMLINLSRAHERNGKLVAAIADLELLLSSFPETSYRGEAMQRLDTMRAKLAATPPPVAQATPAKEPAPAPVPLTNLAVEPTPAAEHGVWPPPLSTILVSGAALAVGAAALGTGLRAHGIYNDLEKRCDADDVCAPSSAPARDHGRALSRASTALTFVWVAPAGTAAVLWVVEVKHSDERGQSSLARGERPRRFHLAFGVDPAGARFRARF
jgi:hypothetical protein